MINNHLVNELAKSALDSNGNVSTKVADYVLGKLTKKELKIFLRKIKKINSEKNVTVKYEGEMTNEIKESIEMMFENKIISYEKDRKLGGGIMIVDNDMIFNYTVSGIIENRMRAI